MREKPCALTFFDMCQAGLSGHISSGGALVAKVAMAHSNSNIDVGELVANIVNHPDFRQTLTNILQSSSSLNTASIVTRNNIVWKLARGYCLCYCKTFSLVPDSTECTKKFLPKSTVHYIISTYNTVHMCQLKSNNIIGQRKTTNTEKHLYL